MLDKNMPRMNGPQTVEENRDRPSLSGLKHFAVTGMSPEDVILGFGAQGVDHWFQKPIQPEELIREMNQGLAA